MCIFDCTKKFLKKYFTVIISIFVIFFLLLITLLTLDYFYNYFDFLETGTKPKNSNGNIAAFNAISVCLLTFVLACVAWVQLKGLNRTAQLDLLTRIDERYGSEPILKARIIIQKFYRESNVQNPNRGESIHRAYIAKRIDDYSRDISNAEEYIYLLNLLDFLETLSYFTNKGDISKEDVKELMGPSMNFFFTIFTPRIEDRQKKYNNNTYYCEFENLVKHLNK